MRRPGPRHLVACLLLSFLVLAPFSHSLSLAADEPFTIVVTIPVLKDFAEQIGGSHVRVTSLLSGYENEHTYSPKPSDLVAVRRAKALFEVGLGLEVWVASLVKNAGSPGLPVITTSDGIALLDDGHDDHHDAGKGGTGNPHIWLDPVNAATMVRRMSDALVEIDPSHAGDYRKNTAAYLALLDQARAELDDRVRGLSDRRFIAHHPAWPYLAKRFGFEIAGTIQLQSGSEPSARQIQKLVQRMKQEQIRVVVSEAQLSQKLPRLLAKETGARVVVLTTLPGGLPGTETYLDMLRYNVLQLVAVLGAV